MNREKGAALADFATSVTIAGIGPGNSTLMTEAVRQAFFQSDVVFGASRMTEILKKMEKIQLEQKDADGEERSAEKIYIDEYRREAVAERILDMEKIDGKRRYFVAVSGDSGFFSGAAGIRRKLEEKGVFAEVFPGISSFSYLCAKVGISGEDAVCLSAHGRELNIASRVRRQAKTFLLTGKNGAELLQRLTDFGLGHVHVIVGENLSYPDERISEGRASEMAHGSYSALTSMLLLNPDPAPYFLSGIEDSAFLRGSVPMTKREIRAQILSLLRLKEDSVAYDIGAGTGSVTVEMALSAWRGKILAVEKNPEGVQLIRANCRNFSADHVTVLEGSAPEALQGLPMPDAVFIGGSGGRLEDILTAFKKAGSSQQESRETCQPQNGRKLQRRSMRLVMTAVTLETIGSGISLLKAHGFHDVEAVQIAAARCEKTGKYHLLKAQSPVFLISGTYEW